MNPARNFRGDYRHVEKVPNDPAVVLGPRKVTNRGGQLIIDHSTKAEEDIAEQGCKKRDKE
jgi:hypothetical protein